MISKKAVIAILILLPAFLSGCVTQNYENDDTPVVQNQANTDDMAATRISLGLGYLKMGNMPQAKQNLEKAKNFAPNMVQVYTAFAHYYETVGEHKLTISSYEKALSIKSDDADTLNNYGVYLCRQDRIEEAEKQFLKAIAVPSYLLVAKSYENLSSCFLQNDDFIKAEMYLQKAILHSPSSSSILFQMIRLQYAMGDYKQAKSFNQRFEKVTRRFTAQFLALSYKVHYKLGERSTAKNYGTMLVKMFPQSWEAQQYLLNELASIEADNLAKRYAALKAANMLNKSKKRIVKLSPKKNEKSGTQTPQQVVAEKEVNRVHLSALTPNRVKELKTAENPVVIQEEPKSATPEQSKKLPSFHVVEKGDTLYSISMKYNIKIETLRLWNNISEKLYIKDIIFLEDPKLVNQ
ncbi:type IV pilus biogenesis/stability protein PilW [Colwellia sp. 6_MG-2023]|uniref:type IV pilus biogenesis/stability protein PilW n=1 Tax=Colwellia sp. 6_MG-2023 TaxID=3062676 RepID=UPI0026E4182F|nr:type IV pilus biogenesis/stability protein PilW [Colwellia sp. 6_MG-2023]MDO6486925.1 type IV pilus biogenesis/stability protein PilW [Colwellia sp. 6_MG-2023]